MEKKEAIKKLKEFEREIQWVKNNPCVDCEPKELCHVCEQFFMRLEIEVKNIKIAYEITDDLIAIKGCGKPLPYSTFCCDENNLCNDCRKLDGGRDEIS